MSWNTARASMAGFLHWWLSELGQLVPGRLRRALGGAPTVLVVRLDDAGGGEAVLHRSGQDPATLLSPGSDPAALRGDARIRRAMLAVGLPDTMRRRIALPLAAAGRLHDVLALDMDRQTPFRAEEIAFTARVVGQDAAARLLTAEVTLVPQATLLRATRLATELGLKLHYAGPTPAPPWTEGDVKPRGSRDTTNAPVARGLAALAAALLLAALLLPAWRAQQRLDALEVELAVARRAADAAFARRAAGEEKMAPASLVQGLGEPATAMLVALTAALPDNAVLRRLSLRDGKVEIIGTSAGTAELVVSLTAAPQFAHVEYRSPVVAVAGGRENFHLALSPRAAAAP